MVGNRYRRSTMSAVPAERWTPGDLHASQIIQTGGDLEPGGRQLVGIRTSMGIKDSVSLSDKMGECLAVVAVTNVANA